VRAPVRALSENFKPSHLSINDAVKAHSVADVGLKPDARSERCGTISRINQVESRGGNIAFDNVVYAKLNRPTNTPWHGLKVKLITKCLVKSEAGRCASNIGDKGMTVRYARGIVGDGKPVVGATCKQHC